MKPQRPRRNPSLMQIAAAVIGSASAAQVVDQARELSHTHATDDLPGVTERPDRLDVIGANGRRLIAFRSPEGVWIGGCLVTHAEDLERLCAWLRGGNDDGR